MAPGTHIGAAHPVSGDGQKVDETMAKKMTSDVAGYARTLAAQRKRNVDARRAGGHREPDLHRAGSARPPSRRSSTSSPTDVPDLLKKLDGRTITPFDGRVVDAAHRGRGDRATVEMTWAQTVLSALAHPQIAYLLLMLGTLGLTVELWNPGAILPGVAGGICLLLAFFAFQVLPVSSAGRAADPVRPRPAGPRGQGHELRPPGVGGVLSLFFGSMMLMDSPLPELQVGLRLIVPVTLAVVGDHPLPGAAGGQGAADAAGHRRGRHARRDRPGADRRSRRAATGRVQTHGEIWTATADRADTRWGHGARRRPSTGCC